jgi:hypothetical protein
MTRWFSYFGGFRSGFHSFQKPWFSGFQVFTPYKGENRKPPETKTAPEDHLMPDRNPHENHLLNRLDWQRRPPAGRAPPPRQLSTTDPIHLRPIRRSVPAPVIADPVEPQPRSDPVLQQKSAETFRTLPSPEITPMSSTTATKDQPLTLSVRSLKITTVLPADALAALKVPDGQPRLTLTIEVGDARYSVDLSAKALRKAVSSVRSLGPENCAALLQGRLDGSKIIDAGLTVQERKQATKPEPAEAAA